MKKPFIYHDTRSDPNNPGWVLRYYDEGGRSFDEALDETRANAHRIALREASAFLEIPMTWIGIHPGDAWCDAPEPQ